MRRRQAARGQHSHLRSVSWRDLERTTHFFEQNAVCQTWCLIRPNLPLQIGQRLAAPLRRCWELLNMSASVLPRWWSCVGLARLSPVGSSD